MHEGKKQVEASFKEVENKLRQTYQSIHGVRIKNQQLQKNSRLFDHRRAQQRLVAIQQEAITSNKKNTALQIKWSELKEYDECQSLSKSIQEQKQSFQMITAAKDRLIDEFWQQIKKKDQQYSKTIKEQSNDIKQMVSKMRDQYFQMRDQCFNQIQEIQHKFQAQRKSYIEKAKTEVDECFKKHINTEQSFTENRRKAEQDFERKIQQLRVEGMQVYSNLKIKMQNDIQNLQKCYEQMKALYQLNTEKLDYNLKVLKEKREQNHHAHEDLKKKERILNIKLRNLRDQYDKADQTFKDHNKLLTSEYKRITRQFKELQRKFKHFQKADLQRYNQIQSMNQIEVQNLKEKIVKCDKVIHNQQLGLEWTSITSEQEKAEELDKEKSKVLQQIEEEGEQQIQLLISQEKLTEIIEILIEEADFIFDDKMRQELQRASNDEKLKAKLQILKKTLSIDTVEEVNIFIQEMANKCKYVSEKEKHAVLEQKLRKEQQAREQEQRMMKKKRKGQDRKIEKAPEVVVQVEEEPQMVDITSDFKVDPVLLVDFLVQWMNSNEQRKKMLQRKTKKSLKQLSQREKKQHIAREGKKYWQNMTQVLPEKNIRIWKVLDKSFSKYHDLLIARQKIIDEAGELHNQNQELKNLLNQYLQINHQLIIPPTRLMDKDN